MPPFTGSTSLATGLLRVNFKFSKGFTLVRLLRFHQRSCKGFTLVELLIVIAVLSVLAVVSYTIYSGITTSTRDTKRKVDLESILKVYEVNFSNGAYQPLANSSFASGTIPKTPEGGYYPCLIGPDNGINSPITCSIVDNARVAYGVTLGGSSSTSCYSSSSTCLISTSNQGEPVNPGTTSSPTCDPLGSLGMGLIGYWDFNGSVLDRSGKGNNGTLNGGTSYSSDVPSGNTQFGQSGSFDGVDDSVGITLNPYPIFPTIHGPSTVSLWFKANALLGNRDLFSDSCTEVGIIHNSATLKGVIYNAPIPNIGTITTGGWHHVVLTHDHPSGLSGTRISVYLDGNQVGSTINFNITTQNGYHDNTFAIGADLNTTCHTPPSNFAGLIDDVRVYNRALSSSEASALYNRGLGCLPN